MNKINKFSQILICLLFFLISCDMTMEKELDIELFSFPPKLSVTAILDGGSGVLEIRLVEGLSLTEHNKVYNNLLYVEYPYGEPPPNSVNDVVSPNIVYFGSENIRDGEIRLYEDGVIILSIPGPFDMSRKIISETIRQGTKLFTLPASGDGWKWGKNGHHQKINGIATRPGSVYRLEADVKGYPLAVSSAEMPVAPSVSVSIDTSVQVLKKNVMEIGSLNYYSYSSFRGYRDFWNGKYSKLYWPFSIDIKNPDINNYLALDLITTGLSNHDFADYWWGIGVSDISLLLDNTGSEIISGENIDLYLFSLLIAKNNEGASRNFYAAISNHSLTLRVRNITPATYRYYRSVSMQYADNLFSAQPTIVIGNIENGYGCFAVFNTTSIPLF